MPIRHVLFPLLFVLGLLANAHAGLIRQELPVSSGSCDRADCSAQSVFSRHAGLPRSPASGTGHIESDLFPSAQTAILRRDANRLLSPNTATEMTIHTASPVIHASILPEPAVSLLELPSLEFSSDPPILPYIGNDPDRVPAPGAFLLASIGVGIVGWLRRRSTSQPGAGSPV